MAKTLYDIPVNEKLIWDYKFRPEEFPTERFFKWYLARVLDNGNSKDLAQIPFKVIQKYLSHLRISKDVRNFWEWYFRYSSGG
ncbi:MAG: hypothetical protein ONB05_04160 [candidate division KSB1 bacterium]|nr:hypothetical protein [candidate division KSB1 bacterium]